MLRTLPLRVAAVAASIATAALPSALNAQKALVYCPVGIDAAGCNTIVAAITADAARFPDGADGAYDGTQGTVDLATVDFTPYAVFVVPSLADGPDAQPYSLLRNETIAARLQAAFVGRVAAWSGTPDVGSANRSAKDGLIRNLAAWAKADAAGTHGPGMVALQDNSDNLAGRYGWLGSISALSVTVDTTFDVYSNVQVLTSTGQTILTNGGLQIAYNNMASFGLVGGLGGRNDATGGRSTRVVLVTAAGESAESGIATVSTDREDYSPGDTVAVTGNGWEPGETVSLLFHEDVDPQIHPDRTLTAVADETGHIFNRDYVINEEDVGIQFILTATGLTSGRTAQTTFTDGNKLVFTTAPFSVAFGTCSPATTVQMFQGSSAENGAPTPVALSSSSAGGTFYSNAACTTAVTSVTIPTSASTVSFFYKDANTGSPVITAVAGIGCSGGNCTVTQTETITGPDLTITKTHLADFIVGVPTSYTITVTNSGTASTSGTVTVTDVQPAGLTFTGAAGTGWTCGGTTTISCTRSNALGAANSYPVIALSVTPTTAGPVTNVATVSGGGEVNTGNDTASDPTTVLAAVDLTVDKSHTGNFTVGVNGTYSVSVTNAGGVASSGTVTVTDVLPTGLGFVSGSGGGWSCSAASGTVTCTRGNAINPGASTPSFTMTVSVAAAALPSVTNTASVSGGGEPAANNGNNSDTDPTTVVAAVDLTIDKSHTGNFTEGVNGSYSLAVSNGGGTATTGTVTVTDPLPTGLGFVSATGTGWTCGFATGTVTCTRVTSIAAGGNAPAIALTVSVAAAAVPSVTNTASVSGGGEPAANNGNNSDSDPTTVVPSNSAPVLAAIGAKSVNELSLLSFTATATDADVPPQTLTFSLDAGAPTGASISTGGAFTWTPTEAQGPGSYPVTIRVSDGALDDFETITITVNEVNLAPQVTGVPTSATIDELSLYSFDADATDGDVPAQTLTFSLVGEPSGATINGSTGAFSWTPTEAQGPGTYPFSVRVSDGVTHTDAPITITVNEVNVPPTLTGVPATATVDELTNYTFDANATDPDAPPQGLTFSLVGEPAGATINGSTGVFSWTPSEAQGPGTYTFAVRVSDGTDHDDANIEITVNEVNVAPTLTNVPATATVDEMVAYTFDADASDSDLPAQTLTFSLIGGPAGATINGSTGAFSWTPSEAQGPGSYSFTVRVSDGVTHDDAVITITVNEVNLAPEITGVPAAPTIDELVAYSFDADASDADIPVQTLTFSLVGQPAGAAINGSTGAFSWTPSEAQGPGVYTFAVRVSDGVTQTDAPISITVNEVNVAPDLTGVPATATVDELTTYTFDADASDTDLPAQTLTFSLVGGPAGATINSSTGAFSWTPTEVQGPGTYPFSVRVSDGVADTDAPITITVKEVNVAPELANIADQSGPWGSPLSFTATATDADLPANTLTFSLTSAPLGATINGSTGAFSWTPPDGQIGPHNITVRVTDNGSPALHDEQTFAVTVEKRPTSLAYTGATSGLYGGLIGVSAILTDALNGSPISGKVVSFTLGTLSVSPTTQSGGAAGVASANLTLAQNVGSYTVGSAFAEDGKYLGSSDSDPFSINPAPLSIKADNKTMFFGAASPPPFTAAYTGFVLGEGTSALGGTLAFSGPATTANSGTPAGSSLTIHPGGHTSTNYAITFVDGTLAVVYNNVAGHKFLQPVNLYPDPKSSFKLGSTIPVKFQLFLANGTTPYGGANATFSYVRTSNAANDPVNEDVIQIAADAGVTFRYDPSGQQYIFNWGTKTLQAGGYTIMADLHDGSPPISAPLELRAK
jgi:uncharacterized repeat protein (TIGR01451 family)